MNTILRLFLCTALLASPAITADSYGRLAGIWLKSCVQRHWKLGAATVSGVVAGFSGWQTLEHMAAQISILNQGRSHLETLSASATVICDELKLLPSRDLASPPQLASIEIKASQINSIIERMLSGEGYEGIEAHRAPLNFWLIVFSVSTIAALLLYDSWYMDSITKHAVNEEDINESCASPSCL